MNRPGGHRAHGDAFTPGRFVIAWCDAVDARDPILLTSQVKTMREGFERAGHRPALLLAVVADGEQDAAVELVTLALDGHGLADAAANFLTAYEAASTSDEEGLLVAIDPDEMRELWHRVDEAAAELREFLRRAANSHPTQEDERG